MRRSFAATLAACLLTFSQTGQTTPAIGQGTWATDLHARDLDGNASNGPEAFFDSARQLTWLDLSYRARSWEDAKHWAQTSSFFGLDGWRLPKAIDKGLDGCNVSYSGGTDCGANVDTSVTSGSELAHLFFNILGNKSLFIAGTGAPQTGYGLTNSGPFQRLLDTTYWIDLTFPEGGSIDHAWYFSPTIGVQGNSPVDNTTLSAFVLREGDVGSAIPEPKTLTLASLAALLMLWTSRRGVPLGASRGSST